MSSTNINSIKQEAKSLSGSGQMTAIEAETINGDIYVEKISQVLIVSLSDEGRETSADRFIKKSTLPYKFLYPYTATDEALFRGRDREIEIIRKRLEDQRVLVVHGQALVGKTSLLAAGVMPAMARGKEGKPAAFAILIEDYEEPEKTILEGLSKPASAADKVAASNEAAAKTVRTFEFNPAQMSKLPLLLEAFIKQSEQTLLLVLDQFERLFEPSISQERRETFLNNLKEALITIEEEKLRVVIVARNEVLEKLGELEGPLRNLLQCPVQVLPLRADDAEFVIEDPLHKVRPETRTIYDGDIVTKHLLPDLEELSDERGFIYPQHLQIVCTQLYLSAHRKKGDTLVIDEELYVNELEGAEAITASFLRETLWTAVTEDQRGLAVRLLAVMSVPGALRWMKAGEFDLKDTDEVEVERVLELLVKAKFLIQSADGNGKKYALVSQMITTELRRMSGTGVEVEERYNAEDELERVWHTWLALEHVASREQVRYLTKSGGHLKPRAAKTLLLLRSAVEHDEQVGTWVERLRGNQEEDKGEENERPEDREGKELIEQLEIPGKTPQGRRIGSTMLVQAKKLLGLSTERKKAGTHEPLAIPLPSPKPAQSSSFGPIAEKAVSAPLPTIRQTCALALAAADPDLALKRLDEALKSDRGWWRRLRRRSELRGVLADADPQIARLNSELPLLQRILVWRWRASRRIARDRHRLAVLTLGGAIGAGLGVGLLRALMAVPPEVPGVQFGVHFFYVGALGAALSYGAALTKSLQLIRENANDQIVEAGSWRSYIPATLLTILLGTIFFGLLHSILVWLNGLSLADDKAYRVILMGFVAGLGLSLALSFHLRTKRLLNIPNWLLSLLLASLTLVFINWYFVYMKTPNSHEPMTILFTLSSDDLQFMDASQIAAQDENPGLTPPWWLTLFRKHSGDFNHLAIIYAILTGVALITGLILGIWWANKSLQKSEHEAGQMRV